MVMLDDHVMSAPELTLNVTEFKAKCLGVLDRLSRGELSRVTVTRRGRPVAIAHPPPTPAAVPTLETFDWEAWRAELRAIDLGLPADFDWTQPILDEAVLDEWEANIAASLSTKGRDEV